MVRIILVRHGRTAWNVDPRAEGTSSMSQGRRFRGTIDLPLAAQGIEQAHATARRLAELSLEAIYSSPLQRALHTAQIIASHHNLEVQVLTGLGSMDYGAWAGRLDSEVAEKWPTLFARWCQEPFGVEIPDGESAADLRTRAVDVVYHLLPPHSDGTGPSAPERATRRRSGTGGSSGTDKLSRIVLVTHQIVTKSLVCALAGLPGEAYWQVRQDLCNLTQFDYEPESGTFTLRGLNDTCHLGSMLPHAHPRSEMSEPGGNGVRLLLVRHGQTAWNAAAGQERFRGRTDLPLDDFGHDQAGALAKRLQDEPIRAIYASPLRRTRQTVAPLAERLGLVVQPETRLLDIDYGLFQGLDHQEAAATFPQQYRSWLSSPGQVRMPGGEGLDDVRGRLVALLDDLARGHRGQTVLLAGHQVVNKVLACILLGLDLDRIWQVGQDTAAISVFQQVAGSWHTLRLNDTCHLLGAGVVPARRTRCEAS